MSRIPFQKLVRRVKTPFYVYDLDLIERQTRLLQSVLPAHTDIHFAMKANSNPGILKFLRKLGLGVDTVSGGEIQRALDVGYGPAEILFSGVGKTETELSLAIKLGIKLVNVESPQELERLGRLARRARKAVALGFRLNPDVRAGTHPYISTGAHANKFGMAFSSLPELKAILKKYRGFLELCAVDFHIGSQLTRLGPLERAIRRTLPIFEHLRAEGYPLRYFDIGGGLGIRYKDETAIDPADYGKMVSKHLGGLNGRILTEPGRVLVGEAGILVTEVQYIKSSPSKTFAIVDTGMHHLIRPALYGAYHEIVPLKARKGRAQVYDVVGPICESSDVLAYDRKLPALKQGDILLIQNAGAYGYSMASHYNLQDPPAEILVRAGRARLTRPQA